MSDHSPPTGVALSLHDVVLDHQLSDQHLRNWLNSCAQEEGHRIHSYSIILCTDQFLLDLNQQYLQHDEWTDIITFDYSKAVSSIHGEAYISLDRVMENATIFDCDVEDELLRVIIHGLLHLCGYGDKTEEEKSIMRKKERDYIHLFSKT